MSDGEYPPGLPKVEDGWPYAIQYAWCVTRDLPLPRKKLAPSAHKAPAPKPIVVEESMRLVPRWRRWSEEEVARLRGGYARHRDAGTLSAFAAALGRPVEGICNKAYKLHLGDASAGQRARMARASRGRA